MKILVLDCETQRWSTDVPGGFGNIKGFGLSMLCGKEISDDHDEFFTFVNDPSAYETMHYDTNDVNMEPFETVQNRLYEADITVSFNGIRFDYIVLESAGFDVENSLRTAYDILVEYAMAKVGHDRYRQKVDLGYSPLELEPVLSAKNRVKLDDLAYANLFDQKLSSAENAVAWWQAAKFLLEQSNKLEKLPSPDNDYFQNADSWRITASSLLQKLEEYCRYDVNLTALLFEKIWRDGELITPASYQTDGEHHIAIRRPCILPEAAEWVKQNGLPF